MNFKKIFNKIRINKKDILTQLSYCNNHKEIPIDFKFIIKKKFDYNLFKRIDVLIIWRTTLCENCKIKWKTKIISKDYDSRIDIDCVVRDLLPIFYKQSAIELANRQLITNTNLKPTAPPVEIECVF